VVVLLRMITIDLVACFADLLYDEDCVVLGPFLDALIHTAEDFLVSCGSLSEAAPHPLTSAQFPGIWQFAV
jgi:hypothetical protein